MLAGNDREGGRHTCVNINNSIDPIVALVNEWMELNEIEEQTEDIADRMDFLSRLICESVPGSYAGIAALLEYTLKDFGNYFSGNVSDDLDRMAIENALEGARRHVKSNNNNHLITHPVSGIR